MPANYTQNITSSEIKIIPPYSDSGIRYEGYCKKLGLGGYISKKQNTKFYSCLVSGPVAFGSHLYTRTNSDTTNFYCTGILIQTTDFSVTPAYFILGDVNNLVSTIKFVYYYLNLGTAENGLWIDLSNCPRQFTGEHIDILTQFNLVAGQYFQMLLFGFEEEK